MNPRQQIRPFQILEKRKLIFIKKWYQNFPNFISNHPWEKIMSHFICYANDTLAGHSHD